MSSVFFTDTDCEMFYTDAEDLKMKVIGMPYTIKGEERVYDFGKNTDIKEFYELMRGGEIVTTSALNSQDYLNYFEPVLAKGKDVLYVHFSSELSGTFNYMQTAINILKEKYPERKVICFDTKNISLGGGIQAIEACKLHNSGKSDEEVIEFLNEFKNKVAVYFYVDSLQYLKRGGRISSAAAFFGGALNIKPILTVTKEGKLDKLCTVKGTKKALDYMVTKFSQEYGNNDSYETYIIDADNKIVGDELAEKIKAVSANAKIRRLSVGPVVGAHAGPGTIGIVFVKA